MALSQCVTIKGREFVARRLTVKDIREVMRETEAGLQPNIIDLLFEDGLPSLAFYRSLCCSEPDVEDLEPEEVKELMELVAAVNPTYADMEKRLSALMKQLRNTSKELA